MRPLYLRLPDSLDAQLRSTLALLSSSRPDLTLADLTRAAISAGLPRLKARTIPHVPYGSLQSPPTTRRPPPR